MGYEKVYEGLKKVQNANKPKAQKVLEKFGVEVDKDGNILENLIIETNNGKKNFGKVTYDAYKAIKGNTLDSYKPKNDEEKKVLEGYKQYTGMFVNTDTSKGNTTNDIYVDTDKLSPNENKKTTSEFENQPSVKAIKDKYGLNVSNITPEDMMNWAKEHNFTFSPKEGNTSKNEFVPKKDGFLGLWGDDLPTEEEKKDAETILALFELSANKKLNEKPSSATEAFGYNFVDFGSGGLGGSAVKKGDEYMKKTLEDAGIDSKYYSPEKVRLANVSAEHPVASSVGAIGGIATSAFTGYNLLKTTGVTSSVSSGVQTYKNILNAGKALGATKGAIRTAKLARILPTIMTMVTPAALTSIRHNSKLSDSDYKQLFKVQSEYNNNPMGKGNIDLTQRPIYQNADGTISTVKSITITENNEVILIPTIVYGNNGVPVSLTDEQAIEYYHKTGEHLGKFDSIAEADAYAKKLSKDQDIYYSNILDDKKDTPLEWLEKQVAAGNAQYAKGLASSLDFILPTEAMGKYDLISKVNDFYGNALYSTSTEAQQSSSNLGKGWETAGEAIQVVTAALPNSITALFLAGANVPGQAVQFSSNKTINAVANYLMHTAKNPQYWTSVLQTMGTDYEEAKSRGANDTVATAYAVFVSAINAGIELGGFQELPNKLMGELAEDTAKRTFAKGFFDWLTSSFEEGGEEVLQSFVSNVVAKIFDHETKWVSETDDKAVVNLSRTAKEFGMGMVAGMFLSGGQIAAVKTINRANISRVGNYMQKFKDEVIAVGLASPQDTESYKIAQKLSKKKGKVSDYELGKLHIANTEQYSVSIGDKFKDTKTGNTFTVTNRDDEKTTVEIETPKGTETKAFTNEQADNFVESGQVEKIESASVVDDYESEADELMNTVYKTITGEKLTSKQIDSILSNPTSRTVFERLTGVKLKGTKAEQRALVRNWQNNSSNVENLKLKNANLNSAHAKVNSLLQNPNSANIRTILRSEALTKAFEELTGITLDGDMDTKRAIIKENVELAKKAFADNVENSDGNARRSVLQSADESVETSKEPIVVDTSDVKVSGIVDAMNETFVSSGKEMLLSALANGGHRADTVTLAKAIRKSYINKGTLGKMADFFTDKGAKVISAIESTLDATTTTETVSKKETVENSELSNKSNVDNNVDNTTTTEAKNKPTTKETVSVDETTKPQTKMPEVKVGDVYTSNGETFTITDRDNTHTTYTVTNENGNVIRKERVENTTADMNFAKKARLYTGVEVGDTYRNNESGVTYTVVSRDSNETTLRNNQNGNTKIMSNETTDSLFAYDDAYTKVTDGNIATPTDASVETNDVHEATDNKGTKSSVNNANEDFINQFNKAINDGSVDSLGLKKVDLSTTGGMIEITEKQSGKFYVRDIGNDTFELYPDKDVSNRAYEALFKPWYDVQRNNGNVISVTKPLIIKDNKFSGRYDLLSKGEVVISTSITEVKSNDNLVTNTQPATTEESSTTERYSLSSMGASFFGNEEITADEFESMLEDGSYKEHQGYKDYVKKCVNVYTQSRGITKLSESNRAEIEKQIEGIINVAIAAKRAGYDIYDDGKERNIEDSKKRLLFSSLEPNSDYVTSSDISTICDKRKNFAEIYEDIVRLEESRGVPKDKRFFNNVDNYFVLHKLMADKGLTIPCEECYVESMRKNLAPMAKAFLDLVTETNPNNKSNASLYNEKGEVKKNNAKIRNKVIELCSGPESLIKLDDITIEMLTTADGLAQLRLQAPLLYETFNSFYGQSKPKMPRAATPFRPGELIALMTDNNGRISKSLVEKIKSTGGFRLQSYSDFQIENYVDVLQTIFEASMLGLNGHAYTKVPAFLEATNGTNLKRNVSIFMYEDNGKWVLDKKNSFPMELEDIYALVASDDSGNTSIIAVSQNADMSAWIMANDNVGYGIPFHKSGLKMDVVRGRIVKTADGREVLGYANQKDHTAQQSEVWKKTLGEKKKENTKVKNAIDIYKFWDFENKDNLSQKELIEKNLKKYIDECNKRNYRPKFREYLMNNENVLNNVLRYAKELGYVPQNATVDDISFKYDEYTIPYGYYKFIGDFGMFKPDGTTSPIETLSLENYDFDKSVEFFADSKKLRTNELLQQFENGTVRDKYRKMIESGELTTEQLESILKEKRKEIANDVVDGKRYSIAMGEDIPLELLSFDDIDDWLDGLTAEEYGAIFGISDTVDTVESLPSKTERRDSFVSKLYEKGKLNDIVTKLVKTKPQMVEYFANTKMNEKHNPLSRSTEDKYIVMFHGTPSADLYTFDTGRIGTHGTVMGSGIYFTASLPYAEGYKEEGGKVIATLLKIDKPLSRDKFTITKDQFKTFIREVVDSTGDDFLSNYGDVNTTGYDKVLSKATDMLFEHNNNDADLIESVYVESRMDFDEFHNGLTDLLGYDGIIAWNKAEGTQAVVFKSNQAKEIFNFNPTSNPDIRYSTDTYAPTFYSHMGKTIDEMKQDKVGANSVVNYLKGKGVKDEEIKWSGIEEFLDGKKSVTKAELQEFVTNNQLQIEENLLEGGEAITLEPQYQTPNGEDSKDLYVIKNGAIHDSLTWNKVDNVWKSDELGYTFSSEESIRNYYGVNENGTRWEKYKLKGGKHYREITFKLPNSTYTNPAMQGHWGNAAEGILAHARVQDMTTKDGKKMLFIEEIQSDWHNHGRKYGYSKAESKELLDEYNAVRSRRKPYHDKIRPVINKACYALNVDDDDVYHALLTGEFDTTQDLELYLSNNNLSEFFTDEDVSNLEKDIELYKQQISIKQKIAENGDGTSSAQDAPFRDNYHEYVLKNIIRMAAEQDYDSIGWTPSEIQSERWSNDYAEGYRIEYDQDIPKFLNKYGKKWGAQIGTAKLNNGTLWSKRNDVWSMDITDSMKDSVLYEGQTLYSLEKEGNNNERQNREDLLSRNSRGEHNESTRKQTERIQEFKQKNKGKARAERKSFAKEILAKGQAEEVIAGRDKYTLIKPEAYNDDMLAMVEDAKSKGYELGFFIGSAKMKFDTKDEFLVNGIIDGSKVLVRYDHFFSPQVLFLHERGHGKWNTPEMQAVKERVLNDLTDDEKQTILSMDRYADYMEIYEGNEDLVWEEFICDMLSGMNTYTANYIDLVADYWAENTVAEGYNASTYAESIDAGDINNSVADIIDYDGFEFSLNDLISSVRIRNVKMKTFPPYNESKSNSNEVSTRWSHKQEVSTGDQNIVFHKDRCYVIEKFDSSDLGYQIVGYINKSDFNTIMNEVKERAKANGIQLLQRSIDRLDALNKKRNTNRGQRYSFGNITTKFGGENNGIQRLGEDQNKRRDITSYSGRSYAYDSSDRKTISGTSETNTKRRYSLDGDDIPDFLDLWEEYVAEYGVIPKGEKPARDIDVPQRISDKDVVSHFARTMLEAGVTPDWAVSEFEKAIVNGEMTHEVVHNKNAHNKAIDNIKKLGFEEALKDWSNKVKTNRSIDEVDFAMGMELYNQCVTNKDVHNAMKLAAELTAEATRSARNLQLCRLLKTMTPDGQLYYLEKSVQKMNEEFKDRLGDKFKDIELDEGLMEKFFNETDEEKRNKVYDDICQDIADQMPATLRDKWDAWRYLAMLGNPRTHLKNFAGNLSFAGAVRLKNYIAATIEYGMEKSGKMDASERTKSFNKSDEAVKFAKEDSDKKEVELLLQGVNAKYTTTGDIESKRTIFKTKLLEGYRNLTFSGLEKVDMKFLKFHYTDALARLITVRNIDIDSLDRKTLDKLRFIAVKEAQKATFRDANVMAESMSKGIKNLRNSKHISMKTLGYVLEGISPFVKTPMNIAKQGVYYSPAGLVIGTYNAFQKRKGADITAAEVIDDFAKGLTGTVAVILGYILASLGILVGGDDEDKKKKTFDELVGEQSYALKLGKHSYTIDWMVPSSMSLFVGNELYKLTKDEFKAADVINAMSRLTEPLLELSVFSGYNDAIKAANYSDTSPVESVIYNALSSYVTQALPTVGGQISRIIDNKKRSYYYMDKTSDIPIFFQRIIGQSASKIPGASYLFSPTVDDWGRDEEYGSLFERVVENTASPGYYSQTNYTEVDKELKRIYDATGDNDVLPSTQSKHFKADGITKYLTADEFAEVKRIRGQMAFKLVSELMSDEKSVKVQNKETGKYRNLTYSQMTDAEKVTKIKSCYDDAGEYAKAKFMVKTYEEAVKQGDTSKKKLLNEANKIIKKYEGN